MRTKDCHYAPSSGGGAAKGGKPLVDFGGALPWEEKGENLRTRGGLGTGYPDGRKGGTEANRGITTPRYTLTPD